MKNQFKVLFLLFAFAFSSQAQDITGVWKTIDDETGDAKSHVTIYEQNGKYFGKVSKILNKDKQDAVCDKCSGSKKDKPILNLVIIENLKKIDENKFSGGKILDPNKGKQYDLTILPDGDKLIVNGGYKVFGKMVGRKQTWHKVKNH